ncbi:MAG TPA: tetratricopeptide repeat protein [Gemmatimonadales bacterium]|nr:tetratricopeptide repeat protein [Gemmatimonadales bacterium]
MAEQRLNDSGSPSRATLLEDARAAALAGDYESALQVLETILSASDEDIDARLLRAAIFQMMEDFVVARSEVMKVLQIAPGNVRALIDLADLQEAEGQWQDALQTLAAAARLVRSGGAYLSREQELEEIIGAQWRCLHVSGEAEKAAATLREGLREVPTSKVLRGLINKR